MELVLSLKEAKSLKSLFNDSIPVTELVIMPRPRKATSRKPTLVEFQNYTQVHKSSIQIPHSNSSLQNISLSLTIPKLTEKPNRSYHSERLVCSSGPRKATQQNSTTIEIQNQPKLQSSPMRISPLHHFSSLNSAFFRNLSQLTKKPNPSVPSPDKD